MDISKGTLHARKGTIKERNGKGLTEAEAIKKRWQSHTHKKKTVQKKKKKVLNELDNHDGVVTHLEPDILECEVK